MWINKKDADLEANKAAQISAGVMLKDDEEYWEPIP